MQTTRTSLVTALLTLSVCVIDRRRRRPDGSPDRVSWEKDNGPWAANSPTSRRTWRLSAPSVESFDDEFTTFYAQPFTLEDFETNMFFGTLGYGICDNWDIFVRAGAADAQDDVILHPATQESVRIGSASTATTDSPGARALAQRSAAPAPGASADWSR